MKLLLASIAADWLSFGFVVTVLADSGIELGVLLPASVFASGAIYVAPSAGHGFIDATEYLAAVAISPFGWVSLSLSVLVL